MKCLLWIEEWGRFEDWEEHCRDNEDMEQTGAGLVII